MNDKADINVAIRELRKAIDLHEKHMRGTAPTTGPAGMRSQQEMMDMMRRAMAALQGNQNALYGLFKMGGM
jgi:hypothetical protein